MTLNGRHWLGETVPVTLVSNNKLILDDAHFQLSEELEGIIWIKGHHDESTDDGKALLAAHKLWWSSLPPRREWMR